MYVLNILALFFAGYTLLVALTHTVIVFDKLTESKVKIMAEKDNKTFARFIDDLLHKEWEERNKGLNETN